MIKKRSSHNGGKFLPSIFLAGYCKENMQRIQYQEINSLIYMDYRPWEKEQ